ncbi:MAG: hypothetical protein AAF657_37655 [Acidobacteriota bacterium]
MSYLDFPRLQFAGTFTADPSTINNVAGNYNEPEEGSPVQPSWNPYGSATFSLEGSVESCLGPNGEPVTGDDPVLTATFQNNTDLLGNPAKLVDLDVDEQTHTRFFGLVFEFSDAAGNLLLRGYFEQEGCLKNLWFGRVPSSSGDNVAGGTMQSYFPVDCQISGKDVSLEWGDISSSPFLQQLQAASEHGLSINFTGYGYHGHHLNPAFRVGKIVGSIGPQESAAPHYKVAKRMLSPTPGSIMWNAPAATCIVEGGRRLLSIDLSNAFPEQSTGGPAIDQGSMWAAVLPDEGQPILLGEYDYKHSFRQTGGIFLVDATAAESQGQRLAILTTQSPSPDYAHGPFQPVETTEGPMFVSLAENANGIYVTVDQSTVYMQPGDETTVDLWASCFGEPLADYEVQLSIIEAKSPKGHPINNEPAGALTFPATATTGAGGHVAVPLSACNPEPKPPRRENINGQLYFVGGPWSAQYNANSQAPSAFTVKIFNSTEVPDQPTWAADAGPILYQFYVLYAYMRKFFDLSDYESVKGASGGIKALINLDFADPGLMPVTRELSRDEITLLTKWIDDGCPAGD